MSDATPKHCPSCHQARQAAESIQRTIDVMDQDIADLMSTCNTLTMENTRLRARVKELEAQELAA